jgi:small subunit ribosomal protein S21e
MYELNPKSYFWILLSFLISFSDLFLYILPLRCVCWVQNYYSAWTTRLISAKDHGSVQINVANVDPITGVYTGDYKAFALAGYIRAKSEGDEALTTLVQKNDAGMSAE